METANRIKLYLGLVCIYLGVIVCVQFYIIYNLRGQLELYRAAAEHGISCEYYKAKECCELISSKSDIDTDISLPLHGRWKRATSSSDVVCPAGSEPLNGMQFFKE